VVEVNPEANLQAEINHWSEMASKVGYDELTSKVSEFQEWLTGIPGIDQLGEYSQPFSVAKLCTRLRSS
jgi:hypothetical protein